MREEQDSPSSYPEGGFGWVVILACFLIHLTFYGIIQTWGVYYSAYVNEYSAGQVSPTTLAFVGTLQPAVRNLLTAGTGIVTNMLGFRTMLLSGTIIFCLGLLLASFVTNPYLLLPTQGAMVGLGGAFLYTPVLAAPSHWFLKRRAFVAGIAISGSGIGGLFWAPATERLIYHLGIPWCLRIHAAILLVTGLITSFMVKPRFPAVKISMFRLETLKDACRPPFLLLTLITFVVFLVDYIPLYLISSFAIDVGATPAQGAIAVGLISGAQALARLIFGAMADWVGYANTLAFTILMTSLTCFAIWIPANTYPLLLVFSWFFGFFSGGILSVSITLIPKIYGLDKTPTYLGLSLGFSGIAVLVGAPLASVLHDSLGYTSAKVFSGSGLAFAFIATIFLRLCLSSRIRAKV